MEIAGSKIAAAERFVRNHPGVVPYPFTSPSDRRNVVLAFEMTRHAAVCQTFYTNGLHKSLKCTAITLSGYSLNKMKGRITTLLSPIYYYYYYYYYDHHHHHHQYEKLRNVK